MSGELSEVTLQQTRTFLEVVFSRKMAALLLLGFFSGLPLFLVGKTLQAWMTHQNVDLKTIGWFSLVSLPYTLKFLWAPLVDRFGLPFLDRRRGWIAAMQLALALGLAAMGLQDPRQGLGVLAALAVLVAFFSATQDIVVDAYSTDALDREELGNGAAVKVFGYRVALLVTGSVALFLADHLSWQQVYLLMAALMGLGVLPTLWAPEPRSSPPPQSLADAVFLPLREFFGRNGWGRGWAILLFIVIYKLCDGLAANMTTPFLLKLGFSNTDLGVFGGIGFGAVTAGVVTGGLLLTRVGIHRCLWLFGFFQAASNLCYLALALVGHDYRLGLLTAGVENFCAGLVTAAFVAFLMSQCNPRYSATQYALLSSLMALGSTVIASPAGVVAEATGWPLFFGFTALMALPGFALLPLFAPWNERSLS